MKKVDLSFQSCNCEYQESDVVIFSVPLDTTTSFRPGTRFAGNAIRVDSIGIEWYSPYLDCSLKDYKTCDIGDLDIGVGNIELAINTIEKTVETILNDGKLGVAIGGEHLITLPILKVMHKKYPDLRVIHFDAHTDLRESFLGNTLSHATFLRHAHKFIGDHKIYQFGIRSGDKEEFEFAKTHTHMQKFNLDGLSDVIDSIKNYPVYITIDLDVLDPSVFPGTGTQEPGGITYKELLDAIMQFRKLNKIVGIDMVELAPNIDTTGSSNIVAAKTLRELVLIAQLQLHK